MASADISFGMIVRDGAATLSACLESVAGLVDEMIVVDTGSADESVAIARGFGARVLSTPWPGDFAAARNVYLKAATRPWVLSLDADETLEATDRAALHAHLARRGPRAFAFEIRNYFRLDATPWPIAPSEFGGEVSRGVGWVASRTVRLFPRRLGVAYQYPVHESLAPSLRRRRIPIARSPLTIHHTGFLAAPDPARRKARLYRDLGLQKIAQYPRYAPAYLELGRACLHDGDYQEAAHLLARSLSLNPFSRSAYYYAALALQRSGQDDAARARLRLGLRLFPKDPDLLYLRGLSELDRGNVIGALEDMQPTLARAPGLMLAPDQSRAADHIPSAQTQS